ncbi:hypothetical protein M5K25_021131 [Dendrobium thyrsiflorum]|uniref:Profilin n=1 Tax=Dendrobium thyrsiflorum TaxID=117978 RepID=A0ABD0UIL6_DENTH
MSWQAYVDDHLLCEIDGQVLTSAAIVGIEGGPLLVDFQFKPEEITAILKDFAEPGSLAPTGLYLGNVKYMVIQGEPGAVIRGKKLQIYRRQHEAGSTAGGGDRSPGEQEAEEVEENPFDDENITLANIRRQMRRQMRAKDREIS